MAPPIDPKNEAGPFPIRKQPANSPAQPASGSGKTQGAESQAGVLREAWQRFATYDQGAIEAQRGFLRQRLGILTFGVLATSMAVVYAFFQGLDSSAEPPSPDQWLFYLRLLVIAMPIVAGGLAAYGVKFDQGLPWVMLRSSAAAVAREIYRHRARSAIYAAAAPGAGRDEKLARRLGRISRRLMHDKVNEMGLRPYEGEKLPPANGAALRDDGFSDLDADDYLALRLEYQLAFYRRKTVGMSRQVRRLQGAVIVLGGLGTFFAAVGLEIWIPIAIAVSGALVSYLELRRLETTLSSYNQAAADLDNVRTWWVSLPAKTRAEAASSTKLVESTEAVIQGETAGWVAELQDSLDELYKEERSTDPAKPLSPSPATARALEKTGEYPTIHQLLDD